MISTGLAGLPIAVAGLALGAALSVGRAIVLGFLPAPFLHWLDSLLREGPRWAADRLVTLLVIGAFAVAMFPLLSLLWEVVRRGMTRVIAAKPSPLDFWTSDMSGIIGGADAGGVFHAAVGTLLITLWA